MSINDLIQIRQKKWVCTGMGGARRKNRSKSTRRIEDFLPFFQWNLYGKECTNTYSKCEYPVYRERRSKPGTNGPRATPMSSFSFPASPLDKESKEHGPLPFDPIQQNCIINPARSHTHRQSIYILYRGSVLGTRVLCSSYVSALSHHYITVTSQSFT